MLTSISRRARASLAPRTSVFHGLVAREFSNDSKTLIPEVLRLKKAKATGTMTKIICTIGPSTDSPEQMSELVGNGMHVARLNFSHAGDDYTYPEALFNMLRDTKGNHESLAAESSTVPMPKNLRAVLVDTKGPGE